MSYQEPKNPSEYKVPTDKPSIVYVTATWCGPCRAIAPIFTKAANDNPNVVFIKVDADACNTLPIVQSVSGVPYFCSFKNGVKFEDFTGANSAKLNDMVAKVQK